jgi:KipI family sensor histidine kinase inhibitor
VRRALRCGEQAVLVECADAADALALWRRLVADAPAGVTEAVPGARTVLVLGRGDTALADELVTLAGVVPDSGEDVEPAAVVPVRYDGIDLKAVAAVVGLSTDEVAERHSATTYVAAFSGFAPGFAYLGDLDTRLRLPRRGTPRTRVPRGSVAIADHYTAVYPGASPGGWHLIGTTPLTMFDPAREPAALLRPGMRVRFERVG